VTGHNCLAVGALLVLIAAPAGAQETKGISIATFAVARDSATAQQAAVTDFLVRQSFQRNPRYAVLDVEGFLSTGTPIAARDQVAHALAQLDKGRQMYDAFELDPAIATLTDAVLSFERGAAALPDMAPYVRALQTLGAAHVLKADKKSARNAFERALLVDPGATLQGSGYPPTVLDAYAAARDTIKSLPQASLSVYSNPAAGEVYVDGIFRGAAPLTVQRLPAGRHVVRVYRAGYQAFGQISDLLEGTEGTLQASLKPTPQAAQFESLLRRAAPESAQDGAGSATQELGAWLKVDQLMIVQVTAAGDDVTLQAAHTDAAGGTRLHAATRTFAFSSQRFRSDVEEFIVGEFRQAQLGVTQGTGTGNQVGSNYAPKRTDRPAHPGYVFGGVSIGAGALFLLTGIGFTIPAVNINNKLARLPQIAANSGKLRSEGQIYFGLAVAGYALTAIAAVTAVVLFAIASSDQETVETILETPGGGGDVPSFAPCATIE
jgi:hypothetical protein